MELLPVLRCIGVVAAVRIALSPTGHAAAIEAPRAFDEAVLDFLKRL
jgi:hypothetical protein